MSPDDPRHGTYAGAQQHRRDDGPMCPTCHEAFRRYQRLHSNERMLGRSRTTPTGPITAHLKALVKNGMTTQAIADLSGVGRATIQDALTRPRATMRTDNAIALLSISPQAVPTGACPSVGTIRRVQALGRLGWSMSKIVATARRIDPDLPITEGTLRQLLHDRPDIVRHRTFVAVSLAYEELSMTLPPRNRQTSQVRVRAERKGWAPPLAWDDIDDPNEKPATITRLSARADVGIDTSVVERILGGDYHLPSTPAEKTAVVTRWAADGRSLNELERRTGWAVHRYYKKGAA